ncbi:hypothetical protein [Flavobacterium sp. N1994]|uniref:hypothetical protein n=1 Tax=Flavobacterium sp. N1994 TaxID=2986827 RepID=UPI0022218201|nr:hypothetical protein [Flavobacterium sp. N1994]
MKKFYFLLIAICALSSCTSDSSSNTSTNPNLLQRIDFYPGLASERHWLFNTHGLLTQITKADGTVVQNFVYDTSNRLTSSTLFNTSGINETHTFTYDNNDFVISVDGETVHYDAGVDAYYTGILNDRYRLTKINGDKLIVEGRTVIIETDITGTNETRWAEMIVNYSNNNIMSYSPGDSCNSFTYDDKTNPIRNATLAICKAFSFVSGSRWIDGLYNSANNVLTHNYCSEDPESSVYHYTYNANNLPEAQTHDSYYHGTYENTVASANYYYQGDVLP